MSYYIKSAGQIHINSATDGAADDSYICLDLRSGQSGSNRSGIGICGAATNSNYQHIAFETTDAERMRINYNGNVGIGTTDPAYSFDVQTTSDASDKTMTRLYSAANATGVSSTGLILEKGAGYGGVIKGFISQGIGSGLSLHTLNGGTEARAMTIMNSGNVGVGTTDPLEKLDVRGAIITPVVSYSGNQDAAYLIAGTSGYTGAATSWNTHGFQHRIKSNSGGVPRITVDAPSGGEVFSIVNGGNVGIGTTSPGSTLDVHGTGIHINGTVLRAMSAIGTVASGTYIKLCDFSALPATTSGVCAIRIRWGTGTGSGTYYYWQGHATGIVGYNTYGDGNGTYNSSGVEPLTLNHHYHYRTVGALSFRIDSDASGTSYGRHSIYMAPNASIDSMSFEVIAMPLRR